MVTSDWFRHSFGLPTESGDIQCSFQDTPVSMGTTILACKFDFGVVLCADSRTSVWPVIANRFARKITPITDNISVCRAGSAADTQAVTMMLRQYIGYHRVELSGTGMNLQQANVRSCASLARLIMYNNRSSLHMGLIVAGVDTVEGPQVYELGGGAVFERDFVICGSGAAYAMGLADTLYKPNFTKEQALNFCTTLVNHAVMRDSASGGCIRYAVITAEGREEGFISADRLKKLEHIGFTS